MTQPLFCAAKRGLLVWLLLTHIQSAPAQEPRSAAALDVLVVAPHSDDEAIGCTGVMLRALERKQRVGVVVITAGDGYPDAAAAVVKKDVAQLVAEDFVKLAELRQRHSLQAIERLGLKVSDVTFLGYPDGGLTKMYAAKDEEPYRQPFTGKTSTYGVVSVDYHQRVHGQPAPYVRKSLLSDLTEIIKTRQPNEIYVTGEADTHGDHRAAFWYVRDAARAAGHRSPLWTFVVHGREPPQAPDRVLTLSEAELKLKRSILEGYQAGVSPVHDQLAATYAKPEERFWAARLAAE